MKKIGIDKMRNSSFVNCWHMNDDESDAQWKIYGHDRPCCINPFKDSCFASSALIPLPLAA